MKKKYMILVSSLFLFSILGVILHIEYIKADEYSNFDGSLKAAYAAQSLEIINMLYFPLVFLTHLILFLFLKYKESKKA